MQENEKKLLTIAGVIVVIMALIFASRFYKESKAALELEAERQAIENNLRQGIIESGEGDDIVREQEWLAKVEPAPMSEASAQTELLNFVRSAAENLELEINKSSFEPSNFDGENYHRAKVQFDVSGTEKNLYAWLVRINSPKDLRTVTFLRIQPRKSNLETVSALVTAEQWFVPESDEEL